MFGFWRRRKPPRTTADTFIEATEGGWGEVPKRIAIDGGSQADFVRQTLQAARQYAIDNQIQIGETFKYIIKDIPVGISSPHEISFGLMMQAFDFGLSADYMRDEQVKFVRLD